jgi:hypothetical protein
MNQALYAHMNNKRKMKKKKRAGEVTQGAKSACLASVRPSANKKKKRRNKLLLKGYPHHATQHR